MKNQYAKFPLTMALLAVLCFLFIVFLMATAVQSLWGHTMVLLIPAIVLGGIGFLALEGILDSKKTTVLTICLSIILLVVSLCYTSFLLIWTATTDTSEVQYYHRAYAQIENGNGVKGVFPETIPADAKDISFHYNPAFLQGGEVFNLGSTEKPISGHEKSRKYT